MKVIRYVRRSEDDKRKQVISIPAQLSETDRIVAYHGLDLVDTLTEERSAKQPGRPLFSELVRRLKSREAEGIVCWKLNRLARNPIDAGELIWLMAKGYLKEVVTCDRTYHNTSMDKFMMYLDFGIANQYVDNLAEDVSRGNRQMLETGLWPGRPPCGYVRDPRYRDDPNFKELLPDTDRSEQMAQMFRMLLAGVTAARLFETVTKEWQFRVPRYRSRGGGIICKAYFYKILRNPFYAGVMLRGGKSYAGRHKPYITAEEFQQIQDILDGRVRPRRAERQRNFPYRGLVRCGSCGAQVTAKVTVNRHGRTYKHYYCYKSGRKNGHCPGGSVQEQSINDVVLNYFAGVRPDAHWLNLAFKKLHELEQCSAAESLEAENKRSKRLKELDSNLELLRTYLVRGVFTEEEYEADRRKLLLEKESIAQHQGQANRNLLEPFQERISWLDQAERLLRGDDDQAKHDFVRQVLLELRLTNRNIDIIAKKPFPALRKRLHSPLSWTLAYVLETFFEDYAPQSDNGIIH